MMAGTDLILMTALRYPTDLINYIISYVYRLDEDEVSGRLLPPEALGFRLPNVTGRRFVHRNNWERMQVENQTVTRRQTEASDVKYGYICSLPCNGAVS
jgi:hypothetical protein